MRKVFLIFAVMLASFFAKAQAVNDMAIIPIGVTLNSIMRLTVNSGGNIEFVVNTMDQYTKGINADFGSTLYTTNISVASSTKFGVTVMADNSNLLGTVNPNNKMNVDFISYQAEAEGENAPTVNGTATPLSSTASYVVGGAADAAQAAGNYNDIKIHWRLNPEGTGGKLTDHASDRYVVNAILQLTAE